MLLSAGAALGDRQKRHALDAAAEGAGLDLIAEIWYCGGGRMSCVFCEEKKTVHRSAVGQGCRTMMTNLSILFGGTDEHDEAD